MPYLNDLGDDCDQNLKLNDCKNHLVGQASQATSTDFGHSSPKLLYVFQNFSIWKLVSDPPL